MNNYEVIVIGTGGVGSAAVFHLAQRGVRVLGLDRFAGAHDRGSSHGQTRLIRQAYCEHPDYVPLVQRAFELWEDLERCSGESLYHEVGLIEIGPPDGMVVPGVLQSAAQHELEIETLDAKDVAERFSGFRLPENSAAVFEQRAGYLLVERCVSAHQAEAVKLGADLQTEHVVQNWRIDKQRVVVKTDRATFNGDRLIIAAGAWASQLLREVNVPLKVLRKPLHWFGNDDSRYLADRGCPAFLYEVPQGIFYGFPQHDARGVKVGQHTGGVAIDDPLQVDREVDVLEREQVEQFLRQFLPGVKGPATDHTVCMYTMSPDDHFIIDRHPAHEQVVFAAGMSGHGFKFTPALGQALADLTLDGTTSLPIQFLNLNRFDPSQV